MHIRQTGHVVVCERVSEWCVSVQGGFLQPIC